MLKGQRKVMSDTRYVNNGLLLFIDGLILSLSGALYWLVISKISPASEIGEATAVFSLVTLVSSLSSLAMEYPLLKKTSRQESKIFGTTLVFQLLITVATLPLVFYTITGFYSNTTEQFMWIAISMLMLSPLIFVPRFGLLGISNVKTIMLVDSASVVVKFVLGYVLVVYGYGVYGILLSFLVQQLITAVGSMIPSVRVFGVRLGNMSLVKEAIKEGLINMPSKVSKVTILSLSVVLLAVFGLSVSSIGVFYMALTISIVAGGFASSIAYMVIPASSASNKDLSTGSLRIGLVFTAPIIVALLTVPKELLSIVGQEYVGADIILAVLALAIIPSSIVWNTISKFNNQNEARKLVTIGIIEISTFLAAFWLLVPGYGILGAAVATMVAFTASAVPSVIWSERIILKHLLVTLGSISAGWVAGMLISLLAANPVITVIFAMGISLAVVFGFKSTSSNEVSGLLRGMLGRKSC